MDLISDDSETEDTKITHPSLAPEHTSRLIPVFTLFSLFFFSPMFYSFSSDPSGTFVFLFPRPFFLKFGLVFFLKSHSRWLKNFDQGSETETGQRRAGKCEVFVREKKEESKVMTFSNSFIWSGHWGERLDDYYANFSVSSFSRCTPSPLYVGCLLSSTLLRFPLVCSALLASRDHFGQESAPNGERWAG